MSYQPYPSTGSTGAPVEPDATCGGCPRCSTRAHQRLERDALRHRPCSTPGAGRGEVGEARASARQLGVERLGDRASRRGATGDLERERERGERPAELVLGTGDQLEPAPQPRHGDGERERGDPAGHAASTSR